MSFPWKKPVDLNLDRIMIVPDKEPKYKVETYSKEELGTLWQHAKGAAFVKSRRALDCGGLVFEDDKPDTLAEAMAALEKGLTDYFEREGIEIE